MIEVDENEEVLSAVMNLSQLRSMHNIDPTLSEQEAIEAIQAIINTPKEESVITAEERIAAAFEFNNLLNMPNIMTYEINKTKILIKGYGLPNG